jgi:ATP-dependent Clp protease adapter protein ClpS
LVWGLIIFALTRFNPLEAAYFFAAYIFVVALHELGHAAAARGLRLKVHAVQFGGLGAMCWIESPKAAKDVLLVYSAGLLAQVGILVLTAIYLALAGPPTSLFGRCVVFIFTAGNVVLFLLSIIPATIKDGVQTDGHVLWKLFLHVFRNQPHPLAMGNIPTRTFNPDTSLLTFRKLVPAGFTTGIEILNDNTTPADFVVATLVKHLQVPQEKAIELMFSIHQNGGLLVPLPTMENAESVAAGITTDARQGGHRLVCRAVDKTQRV